jgi:polysaccharide biosynthesis transport protein
MADRSEHARTHHQAAAEAAGATVPPVEQQHLLDYVRVLHKRRVLVLVTFGLVVAAVAIHTFTATPWYQARVQLLIEDETSNVIIFKDAVETDKTSVDYYQTQYRILQSESMARATLDALDLWEHPEFSPAVRRQATLTGRARAGLASLVRRVRGGHGGDPPPPGESQRVRTFLASLTVEPVKNSRLVDVIFLATDPELAAKVANALAEAYITENRESKFAASKEVSDWLTGQLEEQRQRVEESEAALQRYREANDALAVEDRQNIVVQKLADLNGAATKAKTDRIQREAAYRQLESLITTPEGVHSFPAVVGNPRIQQLRSDLDGLRGRKTQLAQELGERHPEMVKVTLAIEDATRKLREELQMVVQGVRNEYVAAQALEVRLSRALDEQKSEALRLNRKEITYGVLQRDARSNQEIFQSLLQRTRETGISREQAGRNIRIVDAAQTPSRPVQPKPARNLLLAIFGGGLLAVGLAFFGEYLDKRIKTPEEIRQQLRLPCLGLVPRLRHYGPDQPLISNGVPAAFAEAFRTVRTNVLFAAGSDARSLLVTSTGPGEGKTVVAANLAIGLAMIGQRVLLVDGDLRRPRVHETFGVPNQPGLAELLTGKARASGAIAGTSIPGLWVLPAGQSAGNPAELLSSRRFEQVLSALLEHYDWILIDSPPVMAVTDAAILSHVAAGVLFVVTAERTYRANASVALDQLDAARARFVGAVLNSVDLERNAFFYAQYYRREYGAYYHDAAGA